MELISHRGNNNHLFSENTIEALKTALKQNYIDGVELDVRMTKDKKIVMFHNSLVNFNIINQTNYEKLKRHKIDLLDKFLKKTKTNKKIIIEMKPTNNIEVVDVIYKIIKKYNYSNIYICSFSESLMRYFKNKYPKVKVGLVIGNFINQTKKNYDFNVVHYNVINKDWLKREVFVWTVNSKKKYQTVKEYPVITDKAYLLKIDN